MAQVNNNSKWDIEVKEIKQVGTEPSGITGLMTYVVSGVATSVDGDVHFFAAQNNLDRRYADRFKVNWNGSRPRMPKEVGLGLDDEVKEVSTVSKNLFMGRGARIAIARMCKELLGKYLSTDRTALVKAFQESGTQQDDGSSVITADDIGA